MKVALTVWEDRISPLFDSSRTLLIAEIRGGGVRGRRLMGFDCDSAFSRAERLDELGVKVLICGGISRFFASLIEAHRIRIIPFAAGPVEEVIEAFLSGRLSRKRFRMPGCGPRNSKRMERRCDPWNHRKPSG